MDKSLSPDSFVAFLLDDYLECWLRRQMNALSGYEQEALIELVRSTDLHAYFLNFFQSPELTIEFARRCNMIRIGIGPFLRVLLPKLEHFGDGIPWQPSTKVHASWADNALSECGELTLLRRLAHGERYDLVRCTTHSKTHVSIHLVATDNDALDREDQAWLSNDAFARQRELHEELDKQILGWARDRIDQYVEIDRGHFIRYDSDTELLSLYQKKAQCLILESPESDALPDDVRLGPFTFGEWKHITVTGAARALLHLSFATRLSSLNREKLDLRNLLTIFVRNEDLRAVWSEQAGVTSKETLDEISEIFMLTPEQAEDYFASYESPLPYNIRFGKYFSLLPQFGYLGNICAFLVSQLKRKYRKDWDSAVNYREAKFQQELYALLAPPAYQKGRENFVIYKADGARNTDIDAVMYEKGSNSVYLIQLKWFDIFEYSWKERQSKITNLLKANRWVEQVIGWHTSISTERLLSDLGLEGCSGRPSPNIRLMVLTRTAARFGGLHEFDDRAAWISWPQLCRLVSENAGCTAPLEIAWNAANVKMESQRENSKVPVTYTFPGLQVDVYR